MLTWCYQLWTLQDLILLNPKPWGHCPSSEPRSKSCHVQAGADLWAADGVQTERLQEGRAASVAQWQHRVSCLRAHLDQQPSKLWYFVLGHRWRGKSGLQVVKIPRAVTLVAGTCLKNIALDFIWWASSKGLCQRKRKTQSLIFWGRSMDSILQWSLAFNLEVFLVDTWSFFPRPKDPSDGQLILSDSLRHCSRKVCVSWKVGKLSVCSWSTVGDVILGG